MPAMRRSSRLELQYLADLYRLSPSYKESCGGFAKPPRPL